MNNIESSKKSMSKSFFVCWNGIIFLWQHGTCGFAYNTNIPHVPVLKVQVVWISIKAAKLGLSRGSLSSSRSHQNIHKCAMKVTRMQLLSECPCSSHEYFMKAACAGRLPFLWAGICRPTLLVVYYSCKYSICPVDAQNVSSNVCV